jgi:hypothetical protein
MQQDELRDGSDAGADLQHGLRLAQPDEPRQMTERKGRGDAMRTGLPAELVMNVLGDEQVVSVRHELHRALLLFSEMGFATSSSRHGWSRDCYHLNLS